MSEIIPFDFDGQAVRVLMDGEGAEWFVARDVATVLGYSRPHDAIRKRCKGAPIRRPLSTEGGAQEMQLIREADVYRLIVGSRLPAAERFEAWLFEEVLPRLRRTGRYLLEDEAGELDETLPENGRAQRLVDAGRVFGAVSRIITAAERLTPERLETALAVTGSVAGVDLKGLLERGGWRAPALEALPPPARPADRFLSQWSAGALRGPDGEPLPYGPCLGSHLYRVYTGWCAGNGIATPWPVSRFIHYLRTRPGWRAGRSEATWASIGERRRASRKMVVPPDPANPQLPGETRADWLTRGYFAFARAAQPAAY